MKTNTYTFTFINGREITTSAFRIDEAKILAQAQAIQNGWSYEVIDARKEKVVNNYNGGITL